MDGETPVQSVPPPSRATRRGLPRPRSRPCALERSGGSAPVAVAPMDSILEAAALDFNVGSFGFWFAVGAVAVITVALALGYLVGGRGCPRCGRRVATGDLDCSSCGYDFRSIDRT